MDRIHRLKTAPNIGQFSEYQFSKNDFTPWSCENWARKNDPCANHHVLISLRNLCVIWMKVQSHASATLPRRIRCCLVPEFFFFLHIGELYKNCGFT